MTTDTPPVEALPELPDLPEPDGEIIISVIGRACYVDAFRPSTMRDYARAAILADRKAREADALNAARYRWLREHSAPTLNPADNSHPWCARVVGTSHAKWNQPLFGEDLDAAIDAAMAKED